jgi:hypothetical protein
MTFDHFYIALCVIGIPLYFVIALRREAWIVILLLFSWGIGVLLLGAIWAWAIGDLKYLPRWLLFQNMDRSGFRAIPVSYGLMVASILLTLRRLING